MRKAITICVLLLLVSPTIYASKQKVQFSASEQDANIFVDGKLMGKGNLEILITKDACVKVRVEKTGFLIYHIEFCNKKKQTKPPKSYYMEMHRDDAFDASIQTDIANIDIAINVNRSKDEAWKLVNQIVLSYLDVIEVTDKETGYLRTAWQLKTFKQNTIRTRIIVKEASSNPLAFKIKLISEESRRPLTSVKSDELYREWDRVLRKYKDIIQEMQSRL